MKKQPTKSKQFESRHTLKNSPNKSGQIKKDNRVSREALATQNKSSSKVQPR